MIFCVEDEQNIRELLVYTLGATGFDAKGLEDGKSLFKALAKEKPELILLDIMLPGEGRIFDPCQTEIRSGYQEYPCDPGNGKRIGIR